MNASYSPTKTQAPQGQDWEGIAFPLVYLGNNSQDDKASALEWIERHREELLSEATRHGAVLFRGFGLSSPEDFDALISALNVTNFPYKESLSNAVRVNYTERVFSANEAPPSVKIFMHHEMAQTPLYPTTILFFCEQAAEEGGATPICRSDVVYNIVFKEYPEFLKELEAKGLKYSNVMPGDDDPQSGMGRSWQSTLGVASHTEAEERLAELGYSWEWLDGDCLRATTPVLPAVRTLADGRKTLFNQLIAAYAGWSDDRNDPSSAIRLGDDSKLDAKAVARLIEVAYDIAFDLQWQNGDAALIDNTVVMHGRRPFQGKRRVLASLANKETHLHQVAH